MALDNIFGIAGSALNAQTAHAIAAYFVLRKRVDMDEGVAVHLVHASRKNAWARVGAGPAYPGNGKPAYADEIMRMCDLVGPRHVAFGTDMEGVWPNRMMNDYTDLRDVVENLAKRGLPQATLEDVFIGNYARIARAAMAQAQGKA